MNNIEIVEKMCRMLNTDVEHLTLIIDELEKKIEKQEKEINKLEKII